MYKRSQLMKILAVSIVLLFLASGFLVVAYGSGSGKSISSGDKSGNISITNSNIAPVNSSSTNTVIANIAVGIEPLAVAYDLSNGYVYVANFYSNNVSVINGSTNTVIASIAVGASPNGAAYDSSNGYVYVANIFSSTVSVISTSPQVIKIYTVTFTESGLPSGRFWSVNLSGAISNSTEDTRVFLVTNGTYSYTIGSVSGYKASPSSGNITVNGANVKLVITFTPITTTIPPSSYIIIAIVLIAVAIGVAVAMGRRKK